MLTLIDVSFEKEHKLVLNEINLTLPKGRIIGLLGPNGSGKTTLMQTISGALSIQKGKIRLNKRTERQVRIEQIVYMNNETLFSETWTVDKIAKYYSQYCARFNNQRFLGLVTYLNVDASLTLRNLSRGILEKVILAFTFAQDAEYYLLDEPLTGIDMITREKIIRGILAFAPESASIIISSHYIEIFEKLFDDVIFIRDGQIIGFHECEELRQTQRISLSDFYVATYKGGDTIW